MPAIPVLRRFRPIPVRPAVAGLSLIEIMLAVGIFVSGSMIVISMLSTVNQVSTNSLAREARTIAISNLANLVAGTNWDELAVSYSAHQRDWSLSQSSMTLQDLARYRVVSTELGEFQGDRLSNAEGDADKLTFSIEYHRIMDESALGPDSGLWGTQSATSTATAVKGPTTKTLMKNINAATGLNDATLFTQGNPVAARLTVRNGTFNTVEADNLISFATTLP